MIEHSEQIRLFNSIGANLKRRLCAYAIGGTALMFHGLKERTKDIDLVFLNEKDRRNFTYALQQQGYLNALRNIKTLIIDYDKMKYKPMRFESHGKPNFDLFLKNIGPHVFSKSMKERCIQMHDFGNFRIFVTLPEDILFLKSITDRLTDKEDADLIAKNLNVDWKIIYAEAKKQKTLFFLKRFLKELKEQFGTDVPRNLLKY